MTDKQLEDIFAQMKAPEPSETSKNQALNLSLAAFDKKTSINPQGVANEHRLTGINKLINDVRRMTMNKKLVLAGMASAASIGALMIATGGFHFTPDTAGYDPTQISNISANRVSSAANLPHLISITAYLAAFSVAAYSMVKMRKSSRRATALRFGFAAVFLALPFTLNTMATSYYNSAQIHMVPVNFADVSSNESNSPTVLALNDRKAPEQVYEEALSKNKDTERLGAEQAGASAIPQPMLVAPEKSKPLDEWRQRAEEKKSEAQVTDSSEPQSSSVLKNLDAPAEKEVSIKADKSVADRAAMPATSPAVPAGSSKAIGGMAGNMMVMPVAPPPVDAVQNYYQDQGRDNFKDFEESSVIQVAQEPVSTFSIDVDTASYSFMRRQLNAGVLPQKDAVRLEELINYFDYNYALPEKNTDPFMPTIAVYDAPWKQGNKIVHVGIKGYDIETKPQSNIVFLIDTSGSMNSPDKLPLLINSFKMLLDTLAPEDKVGIVVYAGSAGTVLEPTRAGDKHKILQALESLNAGGSTAGGEGIRQAYSLAQQSFIKGGNNRIILASDGDFNVGITDPDELQDFVERKRDEGIYLSVLGFGQGNYNDHTMQALAQNGNGNAAYIDNLNEARKVLVDEVKSTLFTIAKDVKIQVEFNPAMVSEYRLIGYETRHLEKEDFNNDAVDAGEVGAGHTVTAIYEITPTGAPKLVDDLRYGEKADDAKAERIAAPVEKKAGDEYAFLKIRYKKPDSDTSTLMTRPITKADDVAFDSASEDVRFAAAVAGFGQLVKGGKFTGKFNYNDVIEIANAARGRDEFGYRNEFVSLVRLAKSAADMEQQKK